MQTEIDLLKSSLREINDLQSAASLLGWDQETYMPVKGSAARARQLGTLQRIAHEKFISAEMGERLEALLARIDSLPEDSDDAALVRKTHKDYRRALQIPPARLDAFIEHASNTYPVWAQARADDDFSLVAPNLEKTLEFSKEFASYFTGYDHIADPLIEEADPGMKVADIRRVFASLRAELVPLVAAISERPGPDASCLSRGYPEAQQAAFGMSVIKQLGFDPSRSRQDKTHHPFMTKFSLNDVRITTRYDENNFSDGFFSTVHETGHAFYELGIKQDFDGSPLANGTSAGVHESQSRLWENLVGRSKEFWEYFYPQAQAAFPSQLGNISLEAFYAAINKVHRSLIRTEADEVTYNLHVMIRFDLEIAMLEGDLSIQDLPGAWRERYQSDLGVSSPTDADGVLQDVHWYGGIIGGAFQGYTLGNIIGCQFYEEARKQFPDLSDQIRKGQFEPLRGWLTDNVYQYGAKYEPDDLIRRVTGGELDTRPLVRHLRKKFGDLYGLA